MCYLAVYFNSGVGLVAVFVFYIAEPSGSVVIILCGCAVVFNVMLYVVITVHDVTDGFISASVNERFGSLVWFIAYSWCGARFVPHPRWYGDVVVRVSFIWVVQDCFPVSDLLGGVISSCSCCLKQCSMTIAICIGWIVVLCVCISCSMFWKSMSLVSWVAFVAMLFGRPVLLIIRWVCLIAAMVCCGLNASGGNE